MSTAAAATSPDATATVVDDGKAAGAAAAVAPPAVVDPKAAAPEVGADGKPVVKADDKVVSIAPEKYEPFKLPEGMSVDEPTMAEAQTIFRELNLPQAAAQRLVDLQAKTHTSQLAQIKTTIETSKAKWHTDSQADKEFGGDKFNENMAAANKVFTDYGTPELKTLLVESGLGNHPEFVRWAYRVSKAMSEDKVIRGNSGLTQSGQSLDERAVAKLYGSKSA